MTSTVILQCTHTEQEASQKMPWDQNQPVPCHRGTPDSVILFVLFLFSSFQSPQDCRWGVSQSRQALTCFRNII